MSPLRSNAAPWLPGCKGKKTENAKNKFSKYQKESENSIQYTAIRLLGHTWWHGYLASCFFFRRQPPFIYSLFSFNVFWSLLCSILAAEMFIRGVNPLTVSGNSGVGKIALQMQVFH